jgi:hypothetical protein
MSLLNIMSLLYFDNIIFRRNACNKNTKEGHSFLLSLKFARTPSFDHSKNLILFLFHKWKACIEWIVTGQVNLLPGRVQAVHRSAFL